LHEVVRSGSKKFTEQYDGPYKILKKLNDVNYEIRRGQRNQVIHVNKLKRANLLLQDDTEINFSQ
jgi:hypothetical protein